jgi:photosystem I subunit VI
VLAVQDLENTVGSWDMYGQEDTKRYPDMQNEFFERAATGLDSRGAMLRFCALGTRCPMLLPNTYYSCLH